MATLGPNLGPYPGAKLGAKPRAKPGAKPGAKLGPTCTSKLQICQIGKIFPPCGALRKASACCDADYRGVCQVCVRSRVSEAPATVYVQWCRRGAGQHGLAWRMRRRDTMYYVHGVVYSSRHVFQALVVE